MSDELTWEPQDLKTAQILVLALVTGPLMFFGVIAVFSQTQPREAQEGAQETITLLSAVHAFLAPSCWFMAAMLFKLRTRDLGSLDANDPKRLADRVLAGYRQAMILVMALAEGPALFGLVCIFLAWNMGQLEANPAVWANTASTLGLLAAAVAVFPTEFRLRALVERQRSSA